MKQILVIERYTSKQDNDYIVTLSLKHIDGRERNYSYIQQNGVINIRNKKYEDEIIKILIKRLFS